MEEFRSYRKDEPIEVGDVVVYRGRHYAFNTSIVESIDEPDKFGDVNVHLFRPQAVALGGIVSGAYLNAERHSVTGPSGNKDNRSVRRE